MRAVSSLLFNVPPLFAELGRGLAGDIDCSAVAINSYSLDNSPYSVRPQAIVYPKNATDLKHIISFAREYGMPITVCGKRLSRSGGTLGEGIIVDMTRHFTQVRHVNMLEHTITVDAGVTVKTLREKLRGWHMEIPVLTAQDNDATIGGLVATKSSNPSSFHHGTIREWIESATIMVDSGEEHRIADGITPSGRLLGIYQSVFPILAEQSPVIRANKPKTNDDASGYSLWNTSIGPRQLLDEIVGSEGTLGIITTVTLRLTSYKPHVLTTVIPILELSILTSHIDIAKHHRAEHIFLCDSTFVTLTEKFHPGLFPELPQSSHTLLVTHTDTDREKLHNKVRLFTKALGDPRGSCIQTENGAMINHISESKYLFSLLDAYSGGTHVASTIAEGLIVPLHEYGNFITSLHEYLSSLGNTYVITGNAGSGHVSVIALFDPRSPTYEAELSRYAQAVFSLVKKFKGGISATSGDGIIRTPYLSYIYNDATLSIFKKIKEAWDPRLIFNPGKKVSITTQYLHDHIRGLAS